MGRFADGRKRRWGMVEMRIEGSQTIELGLDQETREGEKRRLLDGRGRLDFLYLTHEAPATILNGQTRHGAAWGPRSSINPYHYQQTSTSSNTTASTASASAQLRHDRRQKGEPGDAADCSGRLE